MTSPPRSVVPKIVRLGLAFLVGASLGVVGRDPSEMDQGTLLWSLASGIATMFAYAVDPNGATKVAITVGSIVGDGKPGNVEKSQKRSNKSRKAVPGKGKSCAEPGNQVGKNGDNK